MKIIIERNSLSGVALCGTLSIDGERICDTAEHALYSLPEGEYQLIRHKCKQVGRNALLIKSDDDPDMRCQSCRKMRCVDHNTNLPCRCPRLAPGNGIYNRTDCAILMGTRIAPGCLIHPREPYETLCERLRKSISRGHEVRLVIVN